MENNYEIIESEGIKNYSLLPAVMSLDVESDLENRSIYACRTSCKSSCRSTCRGGCKTCRWGGYNPSNDNQLDLQEIENIFFEVINN